MTHFILRTDGSAHGRMNDAWQFAKAMIAAGKKSVCRILCNRGLGYR
ncbi:MULTISPECIES: hypothetical protein [Xanthomonas]|uniref:Uncharacterized protein n=1 Tax=Xanthomonas campestris pv. phaseoli TaxID=317013 RepID=A0A7Z7J099_XANCH|nr:MULTISPECIES: hypothetical protein [Xanthomonas]QTD87937.1 hypothetical protein XcfCFBP6988P_23620 [Xanthomonas citri pv. phaseoli var. fuscans]QTF14024.1 hypothetical protein XcfCFBP6989P_23530 [Xanthomonas citri pv. phaseoli var. fuscans]QTF14245.1 hypothetical protein XcfCFBP6991P_24275 [Xanthomonas citri pv. phaseoli var. fuscans]QTF76220.1 hypothetical protein XcfCFBP6990P_23565 [Xanthomonas citri pv. phaseoli var. fuscans]UZA98020.1 hypothetical protein OM946_12470 [Xanthomonas citri 